MAQQTLNTPRETTHQRIADALEDIVDKIVDTSSASNIDYDNTQSGLDADKVQGAVDELASEKVDKVEGKGLSTNDYTDAEKTKLAGIEAGAQVNTVTSVAGKIGAVSLVKGDVGLGNVDNTADLNKPISRYTQGALDEKTDISNFNALTQEIELFNTYDLTNDVEISVFANDTYKRDKYDRAYETHIPNIDGEYSVSLGDKTFTETCTFTIANEGKSITETFHTNRKYILGAKLLKAENDEVGYAHVIADVVTLLISKDAPYTTTFDPDIEQPPVTGVLTLKVSVKPDEKYVNEENTGGPAEYAYWGSYNGSDLLINNPILTYSETTFGQPKVSGNPITINDAAEANAVDVSVNIEPIQDLHGYDHPWVGGAGKNLLEVTATGTRTIAGVTYTVNKDGSITCSGTVSGMDAFFIHSTNLELPQGTYIITGGSGVSSSGVRVVISIVGNGSTRWVDVISENGNEFTINEGEKIDDVYLRCQTSETVVNTTIYPMIRKSTDSADWEPYSNICPIIGWDEVNVGVSGVNVWDEEWELGGISNTTGQNTTNNSTIRTKNYIPVVPNTQYYINSNKWQFVSGYDADKNFVGTVPYASSGTGYYINVPSNVHYIRIPFSTAYGTTYNNDISINYPSTDTDYHAYAGKTYTIQFGQTVYKARVYPTKGYAELIGTKYTFDGTETYTSATYGRVYVSASIFSTFKSPTSRGDEANLISEKFKNFNDLFVESDSGQISFFLGQFGFCLEKTNNSGDINALKNVIIGMNVVIELETPITIPLTPQQIRLLKGTNNISCNTGDLSIKYYPDNVLGQLKGDIESEYDEKVETLETQVQELQPSHIFMSRERRDITSDLSRLSIAVAEQNLAKYGYKIGDYFTGASGYTYILADYNTFKGTSTPYCLTQNHLGIVVDAHQALQWHSGDASSVGYNGSTLHTYLKGTVMDNIKSDFIALFGGSTGLEHLLPHSKLLTTALENWGWQSNQYISALSEVQVFGSRVWGANGYQTGEAAKKLELFDKYKWTEIFGNEYPWLRDMSSASHACGAGHGGIAHDAGVTGSLFVVGLINFY